MSKKKSEIPKSRTSSLLSMATKVAFKEGKALFVKHADKRLGNMVSQAEIIVKHVGQLKGAAMKAVQMISVEAQDILPPEVLQVLEQLQSQAPPLSNEVMLGALRDELGEDKFFHLEKLSKKPIASASIGQVYEATLNGQSVVIKIQYPGIAESVDTDLKTLKKLVQALIFVSGKSINIDDLFLELGKVLKLETNYLHEADNLKEYGRLFKGHPDYKVPSLFEDYSTKKILVMSKEEGLEFTEWLKTKPKREQREGVGKKLLNLYMEEFFKNQLVQTDPNPANFLVNSNDQLVLLDFGATVSYDKKFVTDYQSLLKTVFSGDDREILKKIEVLEFMSKKESPVVKDEFVQFIKLSLEPFEASNQPFDFSTHEYPEKIRQQVLSFTKKIKYSSPPSQIFFLHRKLGGIFQLLRKLEAQADLGFYRDVIIGVDNSK